MNIEDSDEEQSLQGLQANIFNEISSPPIQTTTPTITKAGPSEQPTAELLMKPIADAQPEQMVAEHITNMVPEQPIAE